MDSAADFKQAIRSVVSAYKRDYHDEYLLVCEGVSMHRKMLSDPEYGEGEGDMRALSEIPETLENMLTRLLSVEALSWYKEKAGARWFAKNYKEFSLIRRI